jgi:hypothetical protein
MSTFTITLGDQAENHVGMQKIGASASEGFNLEDLTQAKTWFEARGALCSLFNLKSLLPENTPADDAYLLVISKGLDILIHPYTADHFIQEQQILPKDTKAFMYGRVVNKLARHNLCFGDLDQEPDYETGKGRVISFAQVPLLNYVKNAWSHILGEKGNNLVAEANYYYDITKCRYINLLVKYLSFFNKNTIFVETRNE